jgi:hypothetical protein
MAEVQTSTQSGEMSQRFIEFVMMQAQNAALFLGQIPNPQTGEGEVNLELGEDVHRSAADDTGEDPRQLTNEEAAVLRNTLANLQMAFVEVSQSGAGGRAPRAQAPEPTPAPAVAQQAISSCCTCRRTTPAGGARA